MPGNNHESVVTTAVLGDLAAEKVLVVEVGQQIALAKAANLLLIFQGQPHFPQGRLSAMNRENWSA
jgi:hypothetical protein